MTTHTSTIPDWAAPTWSWPTVVLAVLVTLVLFLALPLLEHLSAPPDKDLMLRSVDTTALPPPPPPPPPASPLNDVRRSPPKPELSRPMTKLSPLALSVSFGGLGGLQGDFAADFALAGLDALPSSDDYIFEIADLDEPPRPLGNLPPAYPAQARMRRVQGDVTLEFIVASDGTTGNITVTTAHPPGIFDHAAIQAVQRWRFQPGIRDGMPVATRVRQQLTFNLD